VAIQMVDLFMQGLGELRYQPTDKRVRALVGERTVADSVRAVLVWEPRRVVPYYAVPVEDVLVPLDPAAAERDAAPTAGESGLPFLDHGAFRRHTSPGEELTPRLSDEAPSGGDGDAQAEHPADVAGAADGGRLVGAAFRPADPALADYVVLDFDAFDSWLEEDEPIVGHPRDPFHRVDIRSSSRHVRVLLGDRLLADSDSPVMVFETHLPIRFYLPREDVDSRALRPSARRTTCAYKGEAAYWSVQVDAYLVEDLVWSYAKPLPEADRLAGLMSFFDERVDVIVDGRQRERPLTMWS
jgi:uncharacterized protein (DUF427 family)